MGDGDVTYSHFFFCRYSELLGSVSNDGNYGNSSKTSIEYFGPFSVEAILNKKRKPNRVVQNLEIVIEDIFFNIIIIYLIL